MTTIARSRLPGASSSPVPQVQVQVLVSRSSPERTRLLTVMASANDPQPRRLDGRDYPGDQPYAALQRMAREASLPMLANAGPVTERLAGNTPPAVVAQLIWDAARIDGSTTAMRSLIFDEFDRLDVTSRQTMSLLFDRLLALGVYVAVGVSSLSSLSYEADPLG